MKAAKNTVVSFHYVVTGQDADDTAKPIDSSRERGAPSSTLLGYHQLVPGVERALEGHEAGEQFTVDIPAADAYGERRDGMIQRVSKKYFQHADKLKPGMTTVLQTREGQRSVIVHKIGMSTIDVDHNHPLAGKSLHFEIEITAVRAATPDELEHGHAHEPGSHAH